MQNMYKAYTAVFFERQCAPVGTPFVGGLLLLYITIICYPASKPSLVSAGLGVKGNINWLADATCCNWGTE